MAAVAEDVPTTYARAVGERLRNLRRQQRLSLLAVEEASGREFKASVLGAYERGERIISVLRLQRLAELYGVPVDQLLPRGGAAAAMAQMGAGGELENGSAHALTIDLVHLNDLDAPEKDILRRYISMIQIQRGDFNGKVISIRNEDVRALARVFELDEPTMRERLKDLKLVEEK
ncbi:MAG TPA: transcriptional regulator [Acidimicrobiales bacterium]|nr:transcriptional regulator [Acidimicrobiales bacterium]